MIRTCLNVFFISASALCFEILCIRHLSIIHHTAGAVVVISLALSGGGCSGTFLSFFLTDQRKANSKRYMQIFSFALVILCPLCLMMASLIPFNSFAIIWDKTSLLQFFCLFMLLALPFFCASSVIAIALSSEKDYQGKVYGFDLLGAGFGALIAFLVLDYAPPASGVFVASALAFAGLLIISKDSFRVLLLSLAGAFLILWHTTGPDLSPRWSEYKPLAKSLLLPDTKVISESARRDGYYSLVESKTIPFRFAPGLSYVFSGVLPPQKMLYVDGQSAFPVLEFEKELNHQSHPEEFFNFIPEALPYQLPGPEKEGFSVLQTGLGGGYLIYLARYFGVKNITVTDTPRAFSEMVESHSPRVLREMIGETFLTSQSVQGLFQKQKDEYDLIHLSQTGSDTGQIIAYSHFNEGSLFTLESLESYLSRLKPGGLFVFSGWMQFPPVSIYNLWQSWQQISRKIQPVLIKSLQTHLFMVKKGPWTLQDAELIESFCKEKGFSVITGPFTEDPDLTSPYRELKQNPATVTENYPFDLRPASRQRPFFFHQTKIESFFKWIFSPVASERSQIPVSYVYLWLALLVATICGVFFILAPCVFLPRQRIRVRPFFNTCFCLYFLAIGMAFMGLEITLMEMLITWGFSPAFAITAVISLTLIFSGFGSLSVSVLLPESQTPSFRSAMPFAIIFILTGLFLMFSEVILETVTSGSSLLKLLLTGLGVSPLAFFMGMPLILGLRQIRSADLCYVPWALGINASASVVSAVGVSLLHLHLGFGYTLALSAFLYLAAFLFLSGFAKKGTFYRRTKEN